MKKYIILLLLFAGCASQPSTEIFQTRELNEVAVLKNPSSDLAKMPKVEYESKAISEMEVKRSLEIPLWKYGHALLPDNYYKKIKIKSFYTFNNWFKGSVKQLRHKNLGEGYDCDNFAFLYKALMSVSSYKNDNVHDALVGIIYVKQTHEFGGVDPADNVFHALNIVGTSSGWFVFEPQTGYYDRLEHYKNEIVWWIF